MKRMLLANDYRGGVMNAGFDEEAEGPSSPSLVLKAPCFVSLTPIGAVRPSIVGTTQEFLKRLPLKL
jgi:hypothetical protein